MSVLPSCETCGQPIIPRYCLACGVLIDGHMAADLSHAHPVEGDVSLCLYCSNVAIYTEAGLREPTAEEFKSIMSTEDMQKAVAALATMRAQGKIPPCR